MSRAAGEHGAGGQVSMQQWAAGEHGVAGLVWMQWAAEEHGVAGLVSMQRGAPMKKGAHRLVRLGRERRA